MSADRAHAARVLVVDDDISLAETLSDGLADRGYEAVGVGTSREASRRIATEEFDALVTDLRMPGVDGLELLELWRRSAPNRPVIVMTAYSAIDSAVESIRRGAYHYLTKPFKVDELALFLSRALEEAGLRRETVALRRALRRDFGAENIVGSGGALRESCDLVDRVAEASTPVLIVGETGTGKGLFARAIHAASGRTGAFVTINCTAVPEALLESELFGHVRGAFTGATSARKGLFERASGGTVFLDEIGEMPMPLQAKLLDVIERGVVRALGSDTERPVHTRIVAATHRNLRERARAGAFREDLLFRLDVVRLELPPLRNRLDDLPGLIQYFLDQARARHPQSPVRRFAPDALDRLLRYFWPGNVRELENTIERAVLLGRREEASASELPAALRTEDSTIMEFGGAVVPLAEIERRYARWAFARMGGRKLLTAEKLGVDRKTLSKLLDEGGDDS